MNRHAFVAFFAFAGLAGCEPPLDTTCRCIDGTGEVAIALDALAGLPRPEHADHLIGSALYRIDLDPAAADPDDPRVFAQARVPALVEIEVYAVDGDWLRLYLPQDERTSPLGVPEIDQSGIRGAFLGGEIAGREVVIEDVAVTLEAELGDGRITGTFAAEGAGITIGGGFAGETALFCKPSEPLERDTGGDENGWHRPPFRESPSCLKVLRTLYGE